MLKKSIVTIAIIATFIFPAIAIAGFMNKHDSRKHASHVLINNFARIGNYEVPVQFVPMASGVQQGDITTNKIPDFKNFKITYKQEKKLKLVIIGDQDYFILVPRSFDIKNRPEQGATGSSSAEFYKINGNGWLSVATATPGDLVVYGSAVTWLPWVQNYKQAEYYHLKHTHIPGEKIVKLDHDIYAIQYKKHNKYKVNGIVLFSRSRHIYQSEWFYDQSEPVSLSTCVLNFFLKYDIYQKNQQDTTKAADENAAKEAAAEAERVAELKKQLEIQAVNNLQNNYYINHELTNNRSFTHNYYSMIKIGGKIFYGYENNKGIISWVRPILSKTEFALESYPLGELWCKNSCRIIFVGISRKLSSFSTQIAFNRSNLPSKAMHDLINGKMRLVVNQEIINQPKNKAEKIAHKKQETKAHKAAKIQRLAGLFIQKIQRRVWQAWDTTFANSLRCEVAITLSPTGDIIGQPRIVSGSGNHAFDRAVIQAVESAAPFVPPVGLSYNIFKQVVIKFDAKNLNHA